MKIKAFFLLLILLVISVPVLSFAEKKAITATGKYVMGDLDSKQDARKIALMNAKQMALEKAGTYVSSLTEVKNFQLSRDEISSLTAGLITIEESEAKWTLEGESPVVTMMIKAVVETEDLDAKIKQLKDDQRSVDDYREIREELDRLRKELEELKKEKNEAASPVVISSAVKSEDDRLQKTRKTIDQITVLEDLEEAERALRRGRMGNAQKLLENLIARDPKNLKAHLMLAAIYGKQKVYEKSMGSIDTVLSIAPNAPRAHEAKGRLLLEQEALTPALASFNKALSINPNCAPCYYWRGVTQAKLELYKAAYLDFQRACQKGKKDGCRRVQEMEKKFKNIRK